MRSDCVSRWRSGASRESSSCVHLVRREHRRSRLSRAHREIHHPSQIISGKKHRFPKIGNAHCLWEHKLVSIQKRLRFLNGVTSFGRVLVGERLVFGTYSTS